MKKMLKITPILGLLLVISMITTTAIISTATPPETWNPGDEEELTGHSFNEEYWTNTSIIPEDNPNLNFTMSYVNYSNVQAFLLSFNKCNDSSYAFTFPYQLFGMHYTSNYGHEVFIGALFAFMFAYNDTDGNGVPSEGEGFAIVLPFGFGEIGSENEPISEPLPVEKLSEGHYRFGVRYLNMWAKIINVDSIPLFLATLYLPILTAKFSELNVTYDIQFDVDTGEVITQTFYTTGQVEKLLWLGFIEQDISDYPHLSLGVAHYLTVFTSTHTDEDEPETHSLGSGVDELVEAGITAGGHRAFAVATRGTYDLINETDDSIVATNQNAYNMLFTPRLVDYYLIWWQLGFSADIFCTFAYAMSDYLQDKYDGPKDFVEATLDAGSQALSAASLDNEDYPEFIGGALWYAVCFPEFNGYRVEHDPVYTAYTDMAGIIEEDEEQAALGGIIVLALILLVAVILIRRRRS